MRPMPWPPPRTRIVHSFDELVSTPLAGVNGLCWERRLEGDFAEVVRRLDPRPGVDTLDEARLRKMKLGAAVDVMLDDQRRLRERGLDPQLDCVRGYARDEGVVPTDVYSFHVDRAPVPADTYLCTYFGP